MIDFSALPIIRKRLDKGQFFNAYETHKYGYLVGIGPVSDFLELAQTRSIDFANKMVAMLRAEAGQPEVLSPLVLHEDVPQ